MNPSLNVSGATEQPKVVLRAMEPEDLEWLYAMENDFNAQHRRAEVSIVVQKKHRRKGYAAAAIARIADYSLRVLHLHQLYAVVAEDNEASLALFFSQGFQTHNRLKEWLFDGVEYADAIVLQKIL